MVKKGKNVPGYVVRNSRYMRRHPEEERIIPKTNLKKQEQEIFKDLIKK